jgi:hypothetical protein
MVMQHATGDAPIMQPDCMTMHLARAGDGSLGA